MPVNEDTFDNIPIGQKPLIWPTVHCISNLTRHGCSCSLDGTIVDTTPLVCLYLLARLLQAELEKCLRLVSNLPVQDMETYLGNFHNTRRKNQLKDSCKYP